MDFISFRGKSVKLRDTMIPENSFWKKKYDFVRKSWRTIRYTNNSRKNKSTKNVILVVNREETFDTAGTLWSPDGNCFFMFHDQIHWLAKKLRYNEMDHVFSFVFLGHLP